MSRFKRFASSLLSGYALILANILYTLASIPLALHFLSREEFGLWALVSQVCNFNQIIIDLGMSGAIARILIDHKDDQSSDAYGAVILTGSLVLLIQGLLIALVGGIISFWLPQLMDVPTAHWHEFRLLVIGQCILLAISFVLRIFTFVLQAHQRFDIGNYSQIVCFLLGFIAQWASFAAGLGLYSLLISGAVSTLVLGVTGWWQARRLKLLPASGRWGKPTKKIFKELFLYGTDMFLVSIGLQLITASQAPVITRTLGLEAVAVWSVASKLFTLSQQLVFRLLDFSLAAFSEMMVRGEKTRLQQRFRDLIILSGSASAALAVTMALCNRAFLHLWTHDRISWPIENDILMGCSLIIYAATRCHIGLACITKTVGAMKFIYFAEGVLFVSLGLILAPRMGLTGVILGGILTNILLSGVYGVRRSSRYLGISAGTIVFGWLRPPALVLAGMSTVALALWYATRTLSPVPQILICGIVLGCVGAFCFWRFGLSTSLRQEGVARWVQLRARFAGGT